MLYHKLTTFSLRLFNLSQLKGNPQKSEQEVAYITLCLHKYTGKNTIKPPAGNNVSEGNSFLYDQLHIKKNIFHKMHEDWNKPDFLSTYQGRSTVKVWSKKLWSLTSCYHSISCMRYNNNKGMITIMDFYWLESVIFQSKTFLQWPVHGKYKYHITCIRKVINSISKHLH